MGVVTHQQVTDLTAFVVYSELYFGVVVGAADVFVYDVFEDAFIDLVGCVHVILVVELVYGVCLWLVLCVVLEIELLLNFSVDLGVCVSIVY